VRAAIAVISVYIHDLVCVAVVLVFDSSTGLAEYPAKLWAHIRIRLNSRCPAKVLYSALKVL
jgi:hypothetical protein